MSPGAPLFAERFNPGIEPASRWTIIAKCIVDNGKISRVGYIPCWINEERQTEVLRHNEKGQQMFDFMEKITGGAALNIKYEWAGDEVVAYV